MLRKGHGDLYKAPTEEERRKRALSMLVGNTCTLHFATFVDLNVKGNLKSQKGHSEEFHVII